MGVIILYLVFGMIVTGFVSEWLSVKEPVVSTCMTLFWPCVMFGIVAWELVSLGRTVYKKWDEERNKEDGQE